MNFLVIKPLNLLSLGFIVGLIITLVLYIIAYYQNKRVPKLRKSIFFVITLFAILYTPTLPNLLKIFVLLSLLILAAIINSILYMIEEFLVNYYQKSIDAKKLEKITQIIYLCSFLIGIGLITGGSINFVTYSHYFTKQLIILSLGIWLALKLLYNKPDQI